ncbi:uncharacterized protein K441DRAFT_179635 [Cenococcum geophilum 1.58]|uniref:uncharacterized protein n=1 Tax=Cenococcum geophilum 1.58 TaxID=794803 RepID=UPI00358E791B|nr:hypothetical protein K441DRAFT_179635 [Cenococcum geophilum 1.58]
MEGYISGLPLHHRTSTSNKHRTPAQLSHLNKAHFIKHNFQVNQHHISYHGRRRMLMRRELRLRRDLQLRRENKYHHLLHSPSDLSFQYFAICFLIKSTLLSMASSLHFGFTRFIV